MNKREWKAGQRVRVADVELADPVGDFLEDGDTGTLMERNRDGVPYVLWDGKIWPNSGNDGYAALDDGLEAIE